MSAVYTSTNFNAVAEYKRRKVSYPFRSDPALGTVITRYYEVRESSFSAPALDTSDIEFTNAYCVAVKDRSHRDGELMQYEVDFATIPARREFEIEGLSVRFPGFATSTTPNAAKTVFGLVASTDRKTCVLHVPSHGYSAQTVCGFDLVIGMGNDARQFPISMQGHALIIASSTHALTVRIALPVPAGVPVSFVRGSVRNFNVAFPARAELTEDVVGRAVCDYFLPGVSSELPSNAAMLSLLPARFRIFGSDGQETATLSTTTFPTQAQYEAMIVGDQEILVGATLQRWRGNIWERQLRYAVAR